MVSQVLSFRLLGIFVLFYYLFLVVLDIYDNCDVIFFFNRLVFRVSFFFERDDIRVLFFGGTQALKILVVMIEGEN